MQPKRNCIFNARSVQKVVLGLCLALLHLGVKMVFGVSLEPSGEIVIAGLFPMSENITEGKIGRGVRPAVDLALKMINNDPEILPYHNLTLVPSDTKCDMAVATKFFFDMVDSNSTMVMVFGDACSTVSGPIAEISKWWNMWLLSYGDTDPVLSDRKKYSNFYRTVPSDNDFNPARLALLRKYNWTQVGTIFQGVSKGSARYGHAHNHLISVLEKASINVLKSVGFVNDPEPAITELKEKDVRIILGNFDSSMARLVFCHAFRKGMYGPKYQWVILGGYPDNWWEVKEPHVPCSPSELNTTLYGYIATDILPLSSSREPTESGLTPRQYLHRYEQSNEGHYSKYHAYAFDGVWVIAKVVDNILRRMMYSSAQTDHGEMFRGDSIESALNETNFRGVTGQVQFDRGDRVGSILFEQYQGNGMLKFGEYHRINDHLNLKTGGPIIWRGKGPPLDRKLVRIEYRRVTGSVYYSICTLSGLGIILGILFLMVNIYFRKHRYIKMSSPNMNNIIIIGCILAYLSVFLLGTDGAVVPTKHLRYICTLRAWVLAVGFTLAFGAMFSKTWRVHSIFTNIKLHKKVIKDYKLFLLVSILLVVDSAILVTWHILDPLQISTKNLTTLVEGDLEVIPKVEYCKSNRMSIWLGLIYAYKGMLLVFGCFLAWETRQVSIPALNDSKYIGMSVYNVVIMCVCGAAVTSVINDQPTSSFLIISFFIIFCTTITLCLVFVPKIFELKRDPTGEERPIRAKLAKPKKKNSRDDVSVDWQRKNDELQQENIRCRTVLTDKARLLRSLMEQLGEEDTSVYEIQTTNKTPVHKKVVELRLSDRSPSKHSTGTSMSDVDDSSMFSDSSSYTTTWTMSTPSRRLYQNKRSITSNDALNWSENGKKRTSIQMKQLRSSGKCIETEEDEGDDVFGGVYCGPPKPVNKPCKENGRAKTVTEVYPLVHDIPNKTYMSGVTTEICKPLMDKDLLNNIKLQPGTAGDVTGSQPVGDKIAPLEEPKIKTPSIGKKRRQRKISFMFPNQERIPSVTDFEPQKTMDSKENSEILVPTANKAGLSCDIIEHI